MVWMTQERSSRYTVAFFGSLLAMQLFLSLSAMVRGLPLAIDHPVRFEEFQFFVSQIVSGHSPYTIFPYALGGYPFPMFSYDLGYGIGALAYTLLPISIVTAYQGSVVFSQVSFLLVPGFLLLQKGPPTKVCVALAALFSSLFFFQLSFFGMFHFLLAWTIYAVLVFLLFFSPYVLTYRSAAGIGVLLGLLSYAHPFAFLGGGLAFLVRLATRWHERRLFGLATLFALALAAPRIYAGIVAWGWLHSGIFHPFPSGWATAFLDSFLRPLFFGSSLGGLDHPVDLILEIFRTLPFFAISLTFFLRRNWQKQPQLDRFLGVAVLICVALVLFVFRGNTIYLANERCLSLLFPFFLFSFTRTELWQGVERIFACRRCVVIGFCLLSAFLTARIVYQNIPDTSRPSFQTTARDLKLLCHKAKALPNQPTGRLYVESVYDSPTYPLPVKSNLVAGLVSSCGISILGGWSEDWPFPQWKLFVNRHNRLFGMDLASWTPDMLTAMADIWNVELFLVHRPATKKLLKEAPGRWKSIAEKGVFSLWRRKAPSVWYSTEEPTLQMKLKRSNPDEWTFDVRAPRRAKVHLSRAYDPFTKITTSVGDRLVVDVSRFHQPVITLPPGNYELRVRFIFPLWIWLIPCLGLVLLALSFSKRRNPKQV